MWRIHQSILKLIAFLAIDVNQQGEGFENITNRFKITNLFVLDIG